MQDRLFIHIPKTGGRALKWHAEAKGVCRWVTVGDLPPDYVQEANDHCARMGLSVDFGHARWRDLADEAKRYKSFAIVRNPWSKIVSQYLFARKIASGYPKRHNVTTVHDGVTFEQFLDLRHTWGHEPYFWHRTTVGWYPQREHVTDSDGSLRCDVLRFEHYADDVSAYLGFKDPIAPRNVSSDGQDYRNFYSGDTRDIVGEWFADDVAFFGFTFEGTATRNIWAKEVS